MMATQCGATARRLGTSEGNGMAGCRISSIQCLLLVALTLGSSHVSPVASTSRRQLLTKSGAAGVSASSELTQAQPTSAALSPTGIRITVRLSSQAAALQPPAPCDATFDSATCALLGGALAACTLEDDGLTLTVALPASATITPGQQLTLSSSTNLVAQVDRSLRFRGSVILDGCGDSCEPPRAAIRGPGSVPLTCAGSFSSSQTTVAATFDASSSADPAGRPLSNVAWSVPASVVAGRAVLQAAVSRANAAPMGSRERWTLSLTAGDAVQLPWDDSIFNVSATVTSWLGTSATTTHTFVKSLVPAVQVPGPPEQLFMTGSGLRLRAELADTNVCQGRPLEWVWDAPDGWGALSDAGVIVSQQQLFVPPPVPAMHGQRIMLRVRARFSDSPADAFEQASVTVVAIGSAPVARLSGPSGDITDSTDIVLNATESFDPDTPAASLSFRWLCRREDFPAPCFVDDTRLQGLMEGAGSAVWRIPAGLLSNGLLHTFEVAVVKQGTDGEPLTASASLSLRPRPASLAFPRGVLKRCCGQAGCPAAHSASRALILTLSLEPEYANATVAWSSPDIAGLDSHVREVASGADRMLTVPPDALPAAAPAIAITAEMALDGVSGSATIMVPFDARPYCRLGPADASEQDPNSACLAIDVDQDTFPFEQLDMEVAGFVDSRDAQLRYEFGLVDSAGRERVRALGASTTATLAGLGAGNATVYACAVDSQGARACTYRSSRVRMPAAGYSAQDAQRLLAVYDMSSLMQFKKQGLLLPAASQVAQLSAFLSNAINSGGGSSMAVNATVALAMMELVGNRTVAFSEAILGSTVMQDTDQAFQAFAAVAEMAEAAAPLLPEAAKATVMAAAHQAADVLSKPRVMVGAVDVGFVTQASILLGSSMPSYKLASQLAGPGRALLGNTDASQVASTRLREMLSVGSTLAAVLAREAVPDHTSITAGGGGVYTAAVAVPRAKAAGTSAAVEAGTGAMAASAQLVLQGAAAAAGDGYSLSLQHAPSAAAALAMALDGTLPPGLSTLGGLVTLAWQAGPAASAHPPALGGDSYVLLTLPAPGHNPALQPATCALYDGSISSSTVQLPLPTQLEGSAPFEVVSYNAEAGMVTCRVTQLGSYVVVQRSAAPPPSPSHPPPGPSRRVSLMLEFTMDLSTLKTQERLATFRDGIVTVLAKSFLVPAPAVELSLLEPLVADSIVRVVTTILIPVNTASGAPPKVAFPAAFAVDFGITDIAVTLPPSPPPVPPKVDAAAEVRARLPPPPAPPGNPPPRTKNNKGSDEAFSTVASVTIGVAGAAFLGLAIAAVLTLKQMRRKEPVLPLPLPSAPGPAPALQQHVELLGKLPQQGGPGPAAEGQEHDSHVITVRPAFSQPVIQAWPSAHGDTHTARSSPGAT